MSDTICKLIHNAAFSTVGYIDHNAVLYGLVGFLAGLILGTSICSAI